MKQQSSKNRHPVSGYGEMEDMDDDPADLLESFSLPDPGQPASERDSKRRVARRFIEIMREQRELRAHLEDGFYNCDASW